MVTDPIADMLARIRNAIMANHARAEMPLSKLKVHIAEILKSEGFIEDYSVQSEWPGTLTILLKYGRDRSSAIVGLRRRSRPGRREYVSHLDLPKVMSGMGVSILSTSRGLLTSRQAEQARIGGELLCEVW
ncbi:MAG TPA: 30S ribosomal protein S8 [Polyangiales bacterium]|nr:30S ribosomal protein S8 [Polyangiales bacterium]